MKINSLKDIGKAPSTGACLIYERKKVLFERYANIQELLNKIQEEDVLEIHLFDKEKEYRAIDARRGSIEVIVDFDEKDAYADDQFLIEKYKDIAKSMKVLTKFKTNDVPGMEKSAVVDNYRLVLEEQ